MAGRVHGVYSQHLAWTDITVGVLRLPQHHAPDAGDQAIIGNLPFFFFQEKFDKKSFSFLNRN